MSTNILETKCKACDGEGYHIVDFNDPSHEYGHGQREIPCEDCFGTGEELTPEDRLEIEEQARYEKESKWIGL